MLRIGICDDDEQFALLLEEMVLNYAKTKGLSIDTQTFMSSDKLFECIEEEGLFDILFLDIELGNETGVDIGMTILYIFRGSRKWTFGRRETTNCVSKGVFEKE